MSSPRGLANHSLYLAQLLLAAWRRELAAEELPARVLGQAFAPAVRAHLLDAYGWFLLELQRPAELPPHPPHRVAELPALPAGRVAPAQIDEWARLESAGWLQGLLREPVLKSAKRRVDSLATEADPAQDPVAFEQIAARLVDTFARMSELLDEC